ncbi:multidrug efflux SMR transporter [Gammaproteobacteria bacterium]|nr:multidrug efflux SMR transporter [Gammaproteobacteria bacterium]
MEKYLFLIAAILLEVAGTLMLPLTDSFSKLVPSVVLAVFYLGSFYLLSFAVQMLPLSVVYSTWSGIGVLLVAVMSYAIYGDALKWPAIMGLFFIVGGVMLVNMYTTPQN